MLDCYNLIEILWFARECLGVTSAEVLRTNQSSYTTFLSLRMLTFVSFTGISQLLETTTNLLWRPSLACGFIYIIWHESIPQEKASRVLNFRSDCFLLVFFQSYRGVIEVFDSVVKIGIGTFDYCCFLDKQLDLTFAFFKENAYNIGGHTASPLPLRVFQVFLPVATTSSASQVFSSCEGV